MDADDVLALVKERLDGWGFYDLDFEYNHDFVTDYVGVTFRLRREGLDDIGSYPTWPITETTPEQVESVAAAACAVIYKMAYDQAREKANA